MPSSRPCPSEPPGHLSERPGLCSSCLCEHSCTCSSVHPPAILGTVALPSPAWKEVGCGGADPARFFHARTKAVHGRQTAGRGGVDTSKGARAPSYPESLSPPPTSLQCIDRAG